MGAVTNKVKEPVAIDGTRTFYQYAVYFAVKESFKGVPQPADRMLVYTGLGGGDCGYQFVVGETYLVYASGKEQITTGTCTPTSPAVRVSGLLPQLRALRDKQPVADLFGTIVGPKGLSFADLLNPVPLSDIQVRVFGENQTTFQTRTDQQGGYAFPSLPPGSYQVEVGLPTGFGPFEINGVGSWGRNLTAPLIVAIGSFGVPQCRVDVFASPDGRVSGTVVNGKKEGMAGFVMIKPADPEAKEFGPGCETGGDGSFQLGQLFPGSYQLVFHPKVNNQVRFDIASYSPVIQIGFGQHIDNFLFRIVPSPN
ncbi:MAG TPA: carboxypeptidase regulatory-like domain-containing protein [Pyrinomonadaceae bacterium]|nr:carboxypeptidase regulatory-like domain-containing protein [Pyrinomonadaceae bacterium]